MKTDSHIHTKEFSRDAKMSFCEFLDQCKNYTDAVFCCSEHYDYDYPLKEIGLVFEPEEYFKEYFRRKAYPEAAVRWEPGK